jgi:hypothetical protein
MGNDTLLRRPASWPRFQSGDDLSGSPQSAFFVRSSAGFFVDVAAELGLREPGVARGIAIADVDGDGDLDCAFANQWAAPSFYRNDTSAAHRSLVLRLLVPVAPRGAHRPAVGASAVVHVPAAAGAVAARLVAQVDGGNGHSGKRSPELHFGLGAWHPGRPLRVELTWRDARGGVRKAERQLTAGRHTIILGAEER